MPLDEEAELQVEDRNAEMDDSDGDGDEGDLVNTT